MKPERAINHVILFGPYQGRTLGWVAKFGGPDGRQWLLRQYQTARLQPETMEAIRSFFAAPKYAPWLRKAMKGYPGPEPFWLPEGHAGCRACGEAPMRAEMPLRCVHGLQRGLRLDLRCPCGWQDLREVRVGAVRQPCEDCDTYPLFQRRQA